MDRLQKKKNKRKEKKKALKNVSQVYHFTEKGIAYMREIAKEAGESFDEDYLRNITITK